MIQWINPKGDGFTLKVEVDEGDTFALVTKTKTEALALARKAAKEGPEAIRPPVKKGK